MKWWDTVFGSYTKAIVDHENLTIRFENDNWFEEVPYDEEMISWIKEKGMTIIEKGVKKC